MTDSVIVIATDYGLDPRGLIPDKGKICSLCTLVQTGSEAHSASYLMRTGGCFRGGKATGA
jgi:hypothetical protein